MISLFLLILGGCGMFFVCLLLMLFWNSFVGYFALRSFKGYDSGELRGN